jgi:hypothetical protein
MTTSVRIVFLEYASRSGSTYLMSQLEVPGMLLCSLELDLPNAFWAMDGTSDANLPRVSVEEITTKIWQSPKSSAWWSDRMTLVRCLGDNQKLNLAEFIDRMVDYLLDTRGKFEVVVFKDS